MQREKYTKANTWESNVGHVEVVNGTEVQLPPRLAEYRVVRKLSSSDNPAGDLISGLHTREHPSSVEENINISVAHGKSARRAGPNCILQVVPECGNRPPMKNHCF